MFNRYSCGPGPDRLIHSVRAGYTLVELLVVVTVLGIAGAMVVPSFSQTGALRVQGAVRMVVADITVAQSDAIAFQKGRGMEFFPDVAASRYVVAEVNGTTLDTTLDLITDRMIGGPEFGFAQIEAVHLPDNQLIFDELGGPVDAPGSDNPAETGWIDISGSEQHFRIKIEGYTGRVTVETFIPTPPGG